MSATPAHVRCGLRRVRRRRPRAGGRPGRAARAGLARRTPPRHPRSGRYARRRPQPRGKSPDYRPDRGQRQRQRTDRLHPPAAVAVADRGDRLGGLLRQRTEPLVLLPRIAPRGGSDQLANPQCPLERCSRAAWPTCGATVAAGRGSRGCGTPEHVSPRTTRPLGCSRRGSRAPRRRPSPAQAAAPDRRTAVTAGSVRCRPVEMDRPHSGVSLSIARPGNELSTARVISGRRAASICCQSGRSVSLRPRG
jgi:hypothetical protein